MTTPITTRLLKAVRYIEDHLNDDFALAEVSSAACFSHYHFLRLFHAITGLTTGTYIRRRRLTKAADLLIRTDERIIEIAQEAGFESQAAFTRAFSAMFGLSPAAFRDVKEASTLRGQTVIDEAYLSHLQTRGITMKPHFEKKPAMSFIGVGQDCLLSDPKGIKEAWEQFLARKHNISGLVDENAYGLCYAPQEKEMFSEKFRYTAALHVAPDAPVPDGMEKIDLPAYEYAIFTHSGGLDTLAVTNDYIWKTWLPQSGLELADAPDIEIYGEKWNGDSQTGEIEICLPVVR